MGDSEIINMLKIWTGCVIVLVIIIFYMNT